ncbi:MAG TPA: oligosaccharide flippase family protein [Solirubrobacteraceae bacterium]
MSALHPRPEAEDVLADAHVSARVVRGGGVRIAAFGVVNLMGALGSVVLLRHLGVVNYGRYGTVIALMAIAGGIADAGLMVTGSRELALREEGHERRAFLGAMLGMRIALSSAFVLVGLAVGFAAGFDKDMLVGTVLVGTGWVLIAAQDTTLLPLIIKLRNTRVAVSDLVKQTILLVGIVALTLGGAGIVGFFALQVAVGVGALGVIPILVGRAELAAPRWSLPEWRSVAAVALPVAAALVLTLIYVRVLVVMTSVIADDVQTGLFVTSARIMEMLGGLPFLIGSVILPVVSVAARDDRGRLEYVLARTTESSLLLGSLLAVVLLLGAHPLTILLGGSAFAGAAPVLRTQAPAIITIFLVQAWITFLIGDGRQRQLVRCVVVGLVALVVAGVALIGPYGARGAAGAAVLADVVYATAVYVAVRRLPGRPVPVHRGFCARLVVVIAVALGAGWASGLPDALAAVVAATVFVTLAAVLRMVPVDFYTAIPRPWRGRAAS